MPKRLLVCARLIETMVDDLPDPLRGDLMTLANDLKSRAAMLASDLRVDLIRVAEEAASMERVLHHLTVESNARDWRSERSPDQVEALPRPVSLAQLPGNRAL